MLSGMVVGWLSKKQKCVESSTMEDEFVAASQTVAEMMGIMELLNENVVEIQPSSILHVTNQAARSSKAHQRAIQLCQRSGEKRLRKVQYCESKKCVRTF